ncbi:MAG: NADP oxidoreductase [Micrococcales bacterium 70-64]|nr:NADPH-dependent F420 reductase [Leifsonia sp.]ODU65833.1 MAG: NADP oxidoreductase [Leifsonia sp. SCN 70-46]OJX84460.1 MAG: NADP oxidoreductase [Micrococcales bacterium 70-64]
MTTIGFIGSGHIGTAVAQKAVENGYDVVMSNSRGPETLAALVEQLGPKARAATPVEAAEAADIAVVTVPLKAYRDVPVEQLAGKLVLDTNNYYFERDGHIAALDEKRATVSGLLQEHLPTSRVVKAFNHIGSAEIGTTGSPAGTPDRRALALAGDDADSKQTVADLYDAFGFDSVDVGPLSESWRVERDMPAYGVRQNADELRANLAKATR